MSPIRVPSLFVAAALIGCATAPVPSDPPPPAPVPAGENWLVEQQISICQIEALPSNLAGLR